jgi:hypothetical protein
MSQNAEFGHCERTRSDKRIVLRDRGSKNSRSQLELVNSQQREIRIVEIDGCVIKDGKRCDMLVIFDWENKELYVEFKGNKVGQAVEQLEETIKFMRTRRNARVKECIICTSRNPKTSTEIQKYKKKFKKAYKAKLSIEPGRYSYPVS